MTEKTENEHTQFGELHAWGDSFTIKKLSVGIQVSGNVAMTTVALVDLEEVPLYAVTLPFKFTGEDSMLEGIESLPTKAVALLHNRLIEDGLVLTDTTTNEEDSDD